MKLNLVIIITMASLSTIYAMEQQSLAGSSQRKVGTAKESIHEQEREIVEKLRQMNGGNGWTFMAVSSSALLNIVKTMKRDSNACYYRVLRKARKACNNEKKETDRIMYGRQAKDSFLEFFLSNYSTNFMNGFLAGAAAATATTMAGGLAAYLLYQSL